MQKPQYAFMSKYVYGIAGSAVYDWQPVYMVLYQSFHCVKQTGVRRDVDKRPLLFFYHFCQNTIITIRITFYRYFLMECNQIKLEM